MHQLWSVCFVVLKCFRRISQRFELSTMKEPSLQTDTWWLTYFNSVNYSIAVHINVIICIMLSVTLCWNTKKSDSCDYTNILGSVWSSEQGVKNKLQNVYFSFVGLPGTSSLLHCTALLLWLCSDWQTKSSSCPHML